MTFDFDVKKGWAFSENEKEKAKAIRKRFEELSKKYRIGKINSFQTERMSQDKIDNSIKSFDLFISREPKYHHSIHTILKNTTDLSHEEILIICDSGNLCFGGSYQGNNMYRVSED